ncbi:hypothetical protein GCM10009745_82680 [Kribbella yunnanensis]|uniref:Uncharacterized protein n=1 Tax=Kribbella yunnanensis TaxID=190194 RepID=A0ABP4VAP6_9ACTN
MQTTVDNTLGGARNHGQPGGTGDLAQGNWVDEFDNDPAYRGGVLGDSPAKVWQPEG